MKIELFSIAFLTIFSFVIRVINLDNLDHLIWDELHTIERVRNMLNREMFFSNHPPFAKLIQFVSVSIFGDNPIGWRASQAVFGTLLVPISYMIGKKLFNYKYAGLLTAFFVSFELMFFVQSITALNHIYLMFFIALSLLLFLNRFYFLCAVTSGLTIAIKWIGLVLLPIYLLWLYLNTNIKENLIQKLIKTTIFLLIMVSSYFLTFSFEKENFEFYKKEFNMQFKTIPEAIFSWHKFSFNSHSKVEEQLNEHSSSWFTWPLMYKPVWMSLTTFGYRKANCTVGLGNPLIWWLGALAVLYQLFSFKRKAPKEIIFLLGCYFISFIPFAFIQRPMFMHHYMTALFFLTFILEWTFVGLYKEHPHLRFVLIAIVLLIVFLFFYFYPFVISSSITYPEYHNRLWFESWKYDFKGWKWVF